MKDGKNSLVVMCDYVFQESNWLQNHLNTNSFTSSLNFGASFNYGTYYFIKKIDWRSSKFNKLSQIQLLEVLLLKVWQAAQQPYCLTNCLAL